MEPCREGKDESGTCRLVMIDSFRGRDRGSAKAGVIRAGGLEAIRAQKWIVVAQVVPGPDCDHSEKEGFKSTVTVP